MSSAAMFICYRESTTLTKALEQPPDRTKVDLCVYVLYCQHELPELNYT